MKLERVKTTWQNGKMKLKEYHFTIKPTIIFAAIYLIAMSAVLRANVYYHDDIQRACVGWPTWGFSRHISNFLSSFLHTGTYLADISPLPQFLAVIIIALTSVLVVYLITGEKKFTVWHYISAIPIALSPYFLECLSFKYDSPYMALSVFFSVLPLLFCNGNRIKYIFCTILGVIGMCMSYQASAGIFPMLVIVMGITRWIKGEKTGEVLRFYGISAVGYLLGLVVFRKLLMTELVAYASTTLAPVPELLSCAIYNYKRYIVHFLEGFKLEWIAVTFLICVCFLFTAVMCSKQNKIVTFFVVGAAMIIMFALAFGVYPFLTDPIFYPRAMYGIGCFIAFQGIFASTMVSKGYLAKFGCLVLTWYFFVFSFAYGNALNVQVTYTDFRITEAIDDLLECEAVGSEEPVTLQITGSIGYAPGVKNMLSDFPMLKKLIYPMFQGDGWWGEFGIRNYYALPEFQFAESYDPPEEELPVIADNYYHTICADEDYIWIDLH